MKLLSFREFQIMADTIRMDYSERYSPPGFAGTGRCRPAGGPVGVIFGALLEDDRTSPYAKRPAGFFDHVYPFSCTRTPGAG
jgi:hypothetical protein